MKLFSVDSKLFQGLSKLADWMLLSLMWLLACVPVITAGAATAALFYTADHAVRRDESGVFSAFWKSFRREFRQATVLWGIAVVLYGTIGFALRLALQLTEAGQSPDRTRTILMVIAAVVITLWAQLWFPYLARFEDKLRTLLKNTLFIALAQIPRAFVLLLLAAAVLMLSAVCMVYAPIALFLLPAGYAYLAGRLIDKIFEKFLP